MKIIFLIPPSESKNPDGVALEESLSQYFEQPYEIAKNAIEKDLKCSGNRYQEAIFLNTNTQTSVILPAIKRYNGVMFSAINYDNFSQKAKQFFDENFYIISWLYGIVKPKDLIANYKLPASTKWLYHFWDTKIFDAILDENPDYIVNMLSGDYEKFFKFSKNTQKLWKTKIININFLKENGQKISHGVKPIKWHFIATICKNPDAFFQKINKIKIQNPEKSILEINILKESTR